MNLHTVMSLGYSARSRASYLHPSPVLFHNGLSCHSLKLQQDTPVFAVVGGVPVAFQGPSTTPEGGGLKGVFVLLHGCTHTEADWFSLPEERRIVSLLRSRGYATLALKSRGVCWDSEVGSHIARTAESTS